MEGDNSVSLICVLDHLETHTCSQIHTYTQIHKLIKINKAERKRGKGGNALWVISSYITPTNPYTNTVGAAHHMHAYML